MRTAQVIARELGISAERIAHQQMRFPERARHTGAGVQALRSVRNEEVMPA